MGRYDWPASAESDDDRNGRAAYIARHLPSADVRLPEGVAYPEPAPRPRGRPHGPPTGGRNLWLPIGPSTLIKGQATGDPRVAGRIREMAIEPTAGERIYAAAGSGGVWFSADRGRTWTPLDRFATSPNRETPFPIGNVLACGALLVEWGAAPDGSADTVYVGTGEPGSSGIIDSREGTPGRNMSGVGVLRAVGPGTGATWVREYEALRGQSCWRLRADPAHPGHLFIATSQGLYRRISATAWSRVFGPGEVVDVVVQRLTGPDRLRIWCVQWNGLHVAEVAGAGVPAASTSFSFQAVTLPSQASRSRFALALSGTALWILGRRAKASGDPIDAPAHLWRISADQALSATMSATEIAGVPERLFSPGEHDQSWYDMCIAVHPDRPDRLYVGGSAKWSSRQWNAALYLLEVDDESVSSTFIGRGVHADVHIIEFAAGPTAGQTAVWIGCDGGVFVSNQDGAAGSFEARNTDLAVLEAGFVANHPTNDGIVSAGLQDNGTITRVGDTVWEVRLGGDGGGLAYDPSHDNRFFRQYTHASWESSDSTGIPPVFRRRPGAPDGKLSSEEAESGVSKFYSGCAALAHGGATHLALGTDRIWYSADWGASWVTLPSGTDPRGDGNPDLAQDVLDPGTATGVYVERIGSVRCCGPTRTGLRYTHSKGVLSVRMSARSDTATHHRAQLLALWPTGIAIMRGERAKTSTGNWAWTSHKRIDVRTTVTPAEVTSLRAGGPMAIVPAPNLVNDIAIHDAGRGADGSFYVATIGRDSGDWEIDTLWWYDGDGHCVPTGLRRGRPSPAFTPATNLNGTWTGNRISAPALSIVVDPADTAIVYVGTSVGVVRGRFSMIGDGAGGTKPHWDWQAFDNGLPEAAAHDLAIFDHDGVRLLRVALQARGVWEVDLATEIQQPRTFLRVYPSDTRRRRPTPLTGPAVKGEAGVRWDASPDIVFDTTENDWPWGIREADFVEGRMGGRPTEHAAQRLSRRELQVQVLVHYRWFAELPVADVQVALLMRPISTPGSSVPLGGIWAILVGIANGDPVPDALPDGWSTVGATLLQRPLEPVTARIPRAVSFDANLTALSRGDHICVLAVVLSANDPIAATDIDLPGGGQATTVEQLVLHARHAAARTVKMR